MAIFSVEIVQERQTELFVEAADLKSARVLVRKALKEDKETIRQLLRDSSQEGWVYDGVIDELDSVPAGYEIDYREGDFD